MQDVKAITALIERYFDATYRGDVALLRSVFDPRARVIGEINGVPYAKHIDEYLAGVAGRQSPEEVGDPVVMTLLALDVQHTIAMVKLHVQMLGFNYYNFFSLVRQQRAWRVMTKTLTHQP
ncbi:nuclear transport factor 2 family protein [Aquirhabdus parva]|nr:nuclear transport factor 2 family protein [Aquirhabdus parva]